MNSYKLIIRREKEEEYENVENLIREAFWDVYRPGCNEHLVLHHLRKAVSFIPELDYVSEIDGELVGHIAYSRMFITKEHIMSEQVIAFGPISVLPKVQKMGIGKELIKYTMQKASELGYKAVMITGSDQYYPKLGFEKASDYQVYLPGMEGQEAPFFMVQELEKGYLLKNPGIYDFDTWFNINDSELEEFEKKFKIKKKRAPKETDL